MAGLKRRPRRASGAAIPEHTASGKDVRNRHDGLTPEERDLLNRDASGSWSVDGIRANREGGNFMDPPDEATRQRQGRRRELAKAGRPVIRVMLPEPRRPLTAEQEAQLVHFDRIRKRIGKVDFSVARLIRELRDGGPDVHR